MTPQPNQQDGKRPKRAFHAVLAAALSLSGPALAQVPDVLTTCLNPSDTVERTVETLTSQGWAVATHPDQETLTAIAWTSVPMYMVGDSGGASLSEVLAIKLKTAKGLARKVDLPSSKTRILVRQQADGQDTLVLIARTTPITKRAETHCHVSLTAESGKGLEDQTILSEGAPGFTRVEAPDVAGTGTDQSIDVVLLDPEVLSAETDTDVKTAVVLDTFTSSLMKEE